MLDQLKSWFQLAEIGQSRSSITNPLQWTMVILIAAILLLFKIGLPSWVIDTFVMCLLAVVLLFAYTYLHFMHKNPDVLRSEQYHLSKMAIEHGLLGDSIQGLIKGQDVSRESRLLTGEKSGTESQS
jgi:hypothetical protein